MYYKNKGTKSEESKQTVWMWRCSEQNEAKKKKKSNEETKKKWKKKINKWE